MKADPKVESEVMAVVTKHMEAYAKRQLDSALALWAKDPDVVAIGSGPDEKRVGPAELKVQLERDFAQSEAVSMELGWRSVSTAGSVAWMAANCLIRAKVNGQDISLPGRLTAVLEKRGNRWLFVQQHFSMPYGAQKVGQSFPVH